MKQRILSTDLGHYVEAVWNGKNESEYEPIGDRVLVLPDVASVKTQGNVYVPENVIEENTYASETGILIAMGGDAFLWNSDRTRLWDSLKPEVGMRVYFERYAGGIIKGPDDRMYRVMDDKCICALQVKNHDGAVSNPTDAGESG